MATTTRTATTRVITTASVTVELKEAALVSAFEDAFVEANEALEPQFTREITRAKWYWPSEPSPRDIVDDGILRQSYVATPGRTQYDHGWTVDYALPVHEGALFGASAEGNPTGGFPGRPWTREPIKRFLSVFQKLASARIGGIQ